MWRDVWLIFRREATLSLRNPAWIAIGLMQPLLYLFLFGPLIEPLVATSPGFPPGTAWAILTPALIVQLALFGSSFVGFGLLADVRSGVIERLRVTPANRLALLAGKVLANALQTVFQSVLLVVLTVAVFDLEAPPGGILLCLAMSLLLAISLTSASYALAMRIDDERAFSGALQAVLMPALLLSGILLPITTGLAPDWLYAISRANPFTHIVEAGRATFRGDFSVDAMFTGSVVLLGLTVVCVWWGARTFNRENA